MSFMFVCSEGDKLDEDHKTTDAMVKCEHCGKYAVGGYYCDDCDHSDIDPPDQARRARRRQVHQRAG
jgi:hypothetical protein